MLQPERVPYGKFSHQLMQEAVNLVKEGMSIRKAASEKGLAFKTVARYVKINENQSDAILAPNYTVNKIFSDKEEQSLVDYIINCSKMFYGLKTVDCKKLAYEAAIENKKKIPNSWRLKQMAGDKWLSGFRKRNNALSLRTPELCSLSRASSFTRSNVELFFKNLKEVYSRSNSNYLNGTRVYNLDETSSMTVQRSPKVLAQKGSKQVSKVSSAERGTLVTTCCIVSASGQYLPPVIIFPRVKFKDYMLNGAPTGALGLATKTGWMTSELFVETIKHFIKFSSSSNKNPTLLIFDNHETHINLTALNLAKENGVTILTLPPHSTNKMQPLDVACLKPFKTAYNSYLDSWLMQNPGKAFTIYNVAAAVGHAHEKAFIPTTIISSFKKTGIYPYNEKVFSDLDFMPSTVTDHECLFEKGNIEIEPEINAQIIRIQNKKNNPILNEIEMNALVPESLNEAQIMISSSNSPREEFVPPQVFKKFPKASPRKENLFKIRRGQSIIATDTPAKKKIEDRHKEKLQKNIKKEKFEKNKNKKKIIKKKIRFESNDDESHQKVHDHDINNADDLIEMDSIPTYRKRPELLDYILVEFDDENEKKVNYVGKIIYVGVVDFTVRLYRKIANTNKFIEANFLDFITVPLQCIKLILPEPILNAHTSSQLDSISFSINFPSINLQ